MRLAVHASHQPIGEQDGQREVAVAALRLRQVALDGVVEAEHLHRAPPLNDGVVEWREDADNRSERFGCRIEGTRRRVDALAAIGARLDQFALANANRQPLAHGNPHAGVPAKVRERRLGGEAVGAETNVDDMVGMFGQCGFRRVDAGGQEPFGQFVPLLKPLPFGNHQLAFHEQLLKCPLRRFPIPPTFALAGRMLEIPGEQRAFGANAGQNPSANFGVGAVVPQLAARFGPHHRHGEAVVAHGKVGGRVAPVFERLSRAQQPIDGGFVVAGNAGEEGVVMRPRHHGNGVDLHIAQTLQRLAHAGHSGAEAARAGQSLAPKRDAPQLGGVWRRVPGHRLDEQSPSWDSV